MLWLWAVENGITAGLTETVFGPNQACTPRQMVTFLWRAAGSPHLRPRKIPSQTLRRMHTIMTPVLWAAEQGITGGTSAETFSPNATVTRAQTVTFLYRAAGSPAVSGSGFADVAADAYYADAGGLGRGPGNYLRYHSGDVLSRPGLHPCPRSSPSCIGIGRENCI